MMCVMKLELAGLVDVLDHDFPNEDPFADLD